MALYGTQSSGGEDSWAGGLSDAQCWWDQNIDPPSEKVKSERGWRARVCTGKPRAQILVWRKVLCASSGASLYLPGGFGELREFVSATGGIGVKESGCVHELWPDHTSPSGLMLGRQIRCFVSPSVISLANESRRMKIDNFCFPPRDYILLAGLGARFLRTESWEHCSFRTSQEYWESWWPGWKLCT